MGHKEKEKKNYTIQKYGDKSFTSRQQWLKRLCIASQDCRCHRLAHMFEDAFLWRCGSIVTISYSLVFFSFFFLLKENYLIFLSSSQVNEKMDRHQDAQKIYAITNSASSGRKLFRLSVEPIFQCVCTAL